MSSLATLCFSRPLLNDSSPPEIFLKSSGVAEQAKKRNGQEIHQEKLPSDAKCGQKEGHHQVWDIYLMQLVVSAMSMLCFKNSASPDGFLGHSS